MLNSTKIKYAAAILGAFGAFAVAPATAFALPIDDAGPGGCVHTDSNGDQIPIHDGEDVFVDGKIVSCRGGTIVVTNPPQRTGGLRPQLSPGKLGVLTGANTTSPSNPATPQQPPVVGSPILVATTVR